MRNASQQKQDISLNRSRLRSALQPSRSGFGATCCQPPPPPRYQHICPRRYVSICPPLPPPPPPPPNAFHVSYCFRDASIFTWYLSPRALRRSCFVRRHRIEGLSKRLPLSCHCRSRLRAWTRRTYRWPNWPLKYQRRSCSIPWRTAAAAAQMGCILWWNLLLRAPHSAADNTTAR